MDGGAPPTDVWLHDAVEARTSTISGMDLFASESMRKPPADGVVDTALDARVQRHLKKWLPTPATIVAVQRCTMMGMPTLNWDVELRLPGERTAVSTRDEVPSMPKGMLRQVRSCRR